jgi:hypothetical protein
VQVWQFTRGNPLSIAVHVEATTGGELLPSLATTPVALVFDSQSKRHTLTYTPGVASDGLYVAASSGQPERVEFVKPREWSREPENLPAGIYAVYTRIGAATGDGLPTTQLAVLQVENPPSKGALP